MEVYKSQRGGLILYHDGFEYIKGKELQDGRQRWRCRQCAKLHCTASITSVGDQVTGPTVEHCHPGDPLIGQLSSIRSKIKDASKTTGSSTRNILGQALNGVTDDVLTRLPKNSTLGRHVAYTRQKENLPAPNPDSLHFDN